MGASRRACYVVAFALLVLSLSLKCAFTTFFGFTGATSKAAASSGDLPWHEAFDFLDRLRRVILHDLAGLARAYMGTTLANGRAAPTSSSSPSLSNSNNNANASWEQQCLAAQVLPFVCGCLLDRRTSLSRNSVECLADVFVSAGSEHLKAVAVMENAAQCFEIASVRLCGTKGR